jgi:hypothetical protein
MLVAIAVGVLLFLAAPVISIAFGLKNEQSALSKRHREAGLAIERIYNYFCQYGKWPSKPEVESSVTPFLPPGWEYSEGNGTVGPVLLLDGPYHMILSYRFERPQGESLNSE